MTRSPQEGNGQVGKNNAKQEEVEHQPGEVWFELHDPDSVKTDCITGGQAAGCRNTAELDACYQPQKPGWGISRIRCCDNPACKEWAASLAKVHDES